MDELNGTAGACGDAYDGRHQGTAGGPESSHYADENRQRPVAELEQPAALRLVGDACGVRSPEAKAAQELAADRWCYLLDRAQSSDRKTRVEAAVEMVRTRSFEVHEARTVVAYLEDRLAEIEQAARAVVSWSERVRVFDPVFDRLRAVSCATGQTAEGDNGGVG